MKTVSFDEDLEDSREIELVPNKGPSSAVCVWDFTAKKEMFTPEFLERFMKSNCKKWAFQLEKGDTGFLHWQGRFSLIKKRRKNVVLQLFGDHPRNQPQYLQPTSLANSKELFFYAMKADTRVGDMYCDEYQAKKLGINESYIPKQFKDKILKPFQIDVIEKYMHFNDRYVHLLYSASGNKGRSTAACIAELQYGAYYMPPINDAEKLMAVACNRCMDNNNRKPSFYFDMPRSLNKKDLSSFYCAIEQIKNGYVYDTRYHYKSYWIDSPCIWVFSNEMPDMKLLSKDRWKIWQIGPDDNLVDYNDLDNVVKVVKDRVINDKVILDVNNIDFDLMSAMSSYRLK